MTAISSIRNLGPAVERDCARAGIHDAETLRAIGAHEAYGRMIEAGIRPHFIGYYVLVMALQGRPWNDCKGAEKEALRIEFDRLKAERRGGGSGLPDALAEALDRIGVRPARTQQ
jgi:hypothetical protein